MAQDEKFSETSKSMLFIDGPKVSHIPLRKQVQSTDYLKITDDLPLSKFLGKKAGLAQTQPTYIHRKGQKSNSRLRLVY